MKYDVIGDIHGEIGKLERLLAKLGYRVENGAWGHEGRQGPSSSAISSTWAKAALKSSTPSAPWSAPAARWP
jgi:hypothetical protein